MTSNIPIYGIENLNSYKNEGILVSRFSHYLNKHQHLLKAHKHHFFHLVFFTEGKGEQYLDFKKYNLAPGLIYFMAPGQVHQWHFSEAPEGYIINFSANYFSNFLLEANYLQKFSFFNSLPDAQVLNLDLDTQKKIIPIFEDLILEGANEIPFNDDLVRTLLLRLFIEVNRKVVKSENQQVAPYNSTVISTFKSLIESHYKSLKLPKEYAALMYITPNHLNAVCNDLLGVSAGTLIRDRIILEAKRLLVNLDMRISEIAEQLNFADQSYFIKFFKKYEQITPEKFRKSLTHGS